MGNGHPIKINVMTLRPPAPLVLSGWKIVYIIRGSIKTNYKGITRENRKKSEKFKIEKFQILVQTMGLTSAVECHFPTQSKSHQPAAHKICTHWPIACTSFTHWKLPTVYYQHAICRQENFPWLTTHQNVSHWFLPMEYYPPVIFPPVIIPPDIILPVIIPPVINPPVIIPPVIIPSVLIPPALISSV